jgi:hypothetical protein
MLKLVILFVANRNRSPGELYVAGAPSCRVSQGAGRDATLIDNLGRESRRASEALLRQTT